MTSVLRAGKPPRSNAAPVSQQGAGFDVRRLKEALLVAGPPVLFGLRLWASVCLALYVAFWLELDDPFWAGETAAIVCQPQLGASLRKGWFRMIGTPIGAVAIVVLTACFPQDRGPFLVGLALWGAVCAFFATILRNWAAYAAALAGYTAVIIASDELGATGGTNGEAFTLALTRVSEISIGILSAGIVLAGTDLGGARRRLSTLFAELARGITTHFAATLAFAGPELPDTQPLRRDFIRRVIALDPVIDETLGESSQIRYHSPVLQKAVDGLFAALSAWRAIANHLVRLPGDQARAEATAVLERIPSELIAPGEDAPIRWIARLVDLHRTCNEGVGGLLALPTNMPSVRLLAEKAAEVLVGVSQALNGLALLIGDPACSVALGRSAFRLRVPDWLPALINAGRAFITIGAVALFWIVTAWPSGATAISWAAIPVILFAPRADQAYASAKGFTMGLLLAAALAAIIGFWVLPGLERNSFLTLSIAIGIYLVPTGALVTQPRQRAMFSAMASYFVALLAPTNPMSYDNVKFYNAALAIVAGGAATALFFRLLPPLAPAFRTRRLQALTLRDLRRLAMGRALNDWEGHNYGRLSAMPEQATPLERAELLAAVSVGTEIIRLQTVAGRLGLGAHLKGALAALAQGHSTIATARLIRLDEALARCSENELDALQGRASILVISEALIKHAAYFDAGALG